MAMIDYPNEILRLQQLVSKAAEHLRAKGMSNLADHLVADSKNSFQATDSATVVVDSLVEAAKAVGAAGPSDVRRSVDEQLEAARRSVMTALGGDTPNRFCPACNDGRCWGQAYHLTREGKYAFEIPYSHGEEIPTTSPYPLGSELELWRSFGFQNAARRAYMLEYRSWAEALRASVLTALETFEPGIAGWLAVCARGADEDEHPKVLGHDLKVSSFKKLREISEALRAAVDRKPTPTKIVGLVGRIDKLLTALEQATPGPMEMVPDGRCMTVVTMGAVDHTDDGRPRGTGEPVFRKIARVPDAAAIVQLFNDGKQLLQDMRGLIRSF